jgi:hypothetical protein
MEDYLLSLAEFQEPIVANPVCVRLEPGSLRREELTTYHAHAEPCCVALADNGTVMIHLSDGRTITIGTGRYVTYCQHVIDVAVYRAGRWEMPGYIAQCIVDDFDNDETDVPYCKVGP